MWICGQGLNYLIMPLDVGGIILTHPLCGLQSRKILWIAHGDRIWIILISKDRYFCQISSNFLESISWVVLN